MITILHHVRNEKRETQAIGFTQFDHEPTRDEMIRLRDKLRDENKHATEIILTRKAGDNDPIQARAAQTPKNTTT
jgi:hypothetical protein